MRNYKRLGISAIAVILTMLTAFLLPIQVFAEAIPDREEQNVVSFDNLNEETADANIVSELTERRDKYTKHFRMDDGTIMAVTYDCPVHYKNDKGKWIEYNNTLVAKNEATADEAAPEFFTNKKSNIDIDLAPDTKTDDLVSISSKKGNISWEYTGANKSVAKIKNNNKKHKGNEKFTSIDKLTSQASYNGIYNNVDLDCIVSTTGVKENIILKSADAQNEFEIDYNIKGLKAKQTDEKTIELYKGKKLVYTITAPYMYDADGNTSNDLSLEILSNKGNKLSVKLIADKGFLHSWGRKYPVTIDPEVSLNGPANTETAYVTVNQPNVVYKQQTDFNVGRSKYSGYTYSGLVKLKNIQENYSDKNIVSAKLNLFPMDAYYGMEIEAYPITSSWTNSTATYNNVTYDSEIIDYEKTKSGSFDAVSFDITKYVKKWANGSFANNGIYLKSDDSATIFGGYQCYYANRKPTFVVKYKEYTGLESNLTSHSVPCGQDATFSVCDYTGSLSVKQSFFEENTERFPLSIYATYHSVRNSTNENTGYGWHYSFNQTISEDDNYYIYNDADGINFYFRKEENQTELSDEDDWYTLKYDSNNNRIEIDDGRTTKIFEIVDNTSIYKLKLEKSNENSNNNIKYFYNSAGYMNRITTSLGDYTITRTSDHYICNVRTPNNKYMYFVYYGGTSKIARFTAVDGKASMFYYTSYADDGLLYEVRYYNESNSGTMGGGARCSYNSDNKVSSISELGKNGATRKALSVTYNNDNTTEFKEIANNNKKEIYTFDNYGNTVSVLNANGMITNGSDSGSLGIATGSDSYTKNYVNVSSEPNSGDFVKVSGTVNGQLAGGSLAIDSTTSYLGQKSVKITHSSSDLITYARHTFQLNNYGGKPMTLSAYVKTKDLVKGTLSGVTGALLKIRLLDSSGETISEEDSVAITETIKGSEWQRISVTAYVPVKTTTCKVFGMLRNVKGSAWFDCFQLEEGSVMNDYNALANSDFASTDNWKTQDGNSITKNNGQVELIGNGGEPAQTNEEVSATEETIEEATSATYIQTETETVENGIVKATDAYGNVTKTEQGFVTREYRRTYEVAEDNSSSSDSEESEEDESENINCNNYIYQEVDVNKKDVSFVLSGSAKAQSVPLNSDYRTFGIALKVKYDGDSDYSEQHYQEFNAYTDIMQNVSLSVSPYETDKVVEKVAFAFVYGYNKNKMVVKNAMLNYAYNGTNADETGNTGIYEVGATEPETTEPENSGYLVDEEVLSESVENDDPSKPYMQSSTTYGNNGNYVVGETDESGNTVSYTVDGDGNTTSIIDAKNNLTSYTYDVHGNMLSVSSGNASNTYTYNACNELSKITHNGFNYNYTYDNFNNLTSVKVGSNSLAEYTYDSNNDKLTRVTYGNGNYISYNYNDYGRITSVRNETKTLAAYFYNKKGLLTEFKNHKSGETTEYCYDCNGNALYKYIISSDGELLSVTDGDTEKITINGSVRTITNGTDEDGKSYVQNGKAKVTTDTDDFGRTTKVTTKVDNSPKYSVNYTYKNVDGTNRTTNNVDEITYKLGDDNEVVKYKYNYDANGNISSFYENNSIIMQFSYDSLNQIANYVDKNASCFTFYDYDDGGNILKKSIYNMHSVGWFPNGLREIVSYSYTDSIWGDLLTSYDGQTITYDAIGNPLSYRDGMTMSWTGRELQSITKGNNTYTFTYNLDGLRTKKNSNGTNTLYYYDDSNNLIGLKKGNTTVLFYYDSNGQVYSMSKGESTYFFIKNLQGDVMKIIDENGTTVATYVYDAWGALLSQSENGSIAGLSPFRYRSYVYDTDTELYYLQSRYYDPKTGRFINADSPEYTDTYSGSPLSTNMFAYCENNPVIGIDQGGNAVKNTNSNKVNNRKSFIIYYFANGGIGQKMNPTTVNYGEKTKLRACTYHKKDYIFSGWTAYRTSDKKWLCQDKYSGKTKWLTEMQLKINQNQYVKYLYKNGQYVSKTSSVKNDKVNMYAQWKRRTYKRVGRGAFDINVSNDNDNPFPYTITVYYSFNDYFYLDGDKITYFYRTLYVTASTPRISPGFNCSCFNYRYVDNNGKTLKAFNMKNVGDYVVPAGVCYLYYKYSDEKISYKRKNSNKGAFALSVSKQYATLNWSKTIKYSLFY